MSNPISRWPVIGMLVTSAACVGTIGGGAAFDDRDNPTGSATDQLVIQSLTLYGSTDEPSDVTVAGVADEDGSADTSFRVTFQLEDCLAADCLPADGPKARTYRLNLRSDTADQAHYRRVNVTLHR